LTKENRDDIKFIPSRPQGGYPGVAARMLNPKGAMFKEQIFAGDENAKYTQYTGEDYVKREVDGSVFYIEEEVNGNYKSFKSINGVRFIAHGAGKVLAIGAGWRAAIAHEEAFEQ
jgi:hypothetical protein